MIKTIFATLFVIAFVALLGSFRTVEAAPCTYSAPPATIPTGHPFTVTISGVPLTHRVEVGLKKNITLYSVQRQFGSGDVIMTAPPESTEPYILYATDLDDPTDNKLCSITPEGSSPLVTVTGSLSGETNIIVNDLRSQITVLSPTQALVDFIWTPNANTDGRIFIGPSASPINNPTTSVAVNTSTGAVEGGILPGGNYYAAMYTGFYGEVRMSNIISFTVAGGSDDSGPVVADSCTGFLNCLAGIESPTKAFNETGLVGALFTIILPIVIGLGAFLTVIIIVVSGIQFITSNGNPEGAAAARGRLTFAIIGLALLILAYAITQIVDNIFLRGSGVF